MKLNFEKQLPTTLIDREKKREAESDVKRHLQAVKSHWKALQQMPDIADAVRTLDDALDGGEAKNIIGKKMFEIDLLPLPYDEKKALINQWEKMLVEVENHVEELNNSFDFFPLGYLQCKEENNPDTLFISQKDLRLTIEEVAKVKIPQEAHDLYAEWLKVVEAAKNFEQYQFNHNLNVRDVVSVFEHMRDANDFAKNWYYGTWKRYIK